MFFKNDFYFFSPWAGVAPFETLQSSRPGGCKGRMLEAWEAQARVPNGLKKPIETLQSSRPGALPGCNLRALEAWGLQGSNPRGLAGPGQSA